MDEQRDMGAPSAAAEWWPRASLLHDATAMEVVRRVVARMLEHKRTERWFRVWIPGCGSGEGVYAMAAVIRDAIDRSGATLTARIFATDHDRKALRRARRGWYGAPLSEHVAARDLAVHFVEDEHGFQATQSLRDMCIFATHDVLRDPPLHGIDMIACGDLPLAQDPEIGMKLGRTFRFSLRSHGVLIVDPVLNVADPLRFATEVPELGLFRARGETWPDVAPSHLSPFELTPQDPMEPVGDDIVEPGSELESLRRALQSADDRNEQLACLNEELRCAQEELQAANEDLQSLNLELQSRVDEVDKLRNDLDNLLRSTRIPTVSVDVEGNIKWFSPVATEVLHVRSADVGRPLGDLKPRVSGSDLSREAALVLHEGTAREIAVQRATPGADPPVVHYRVRLMPDHRPPGGIEGVVISFVDVTDLKVVKRTLERQAEQQRAVTELGLFALEGSIEELFERTVHEVRSALRVPSCELRSLDPLAETLVLEAAAGRPHPPASEDARVGSAAAQELAERQPSIKSTSAPHLVDAGIVHTLSAPVRDGTSVYALLRVHATDRYALGPDEVAFVGLITNILGSAVGRHRALARLREQAQHKDDFLAMLGHELRNPLAAISSAHDLQEHIESGDQLLVKTRAAIGRQVTQMVRIIDDLLDVSRFARGKIVLERESLDLCALVRSVVDDHEPLARSGLEHELVMSGQPIIVHGDRQRLAQVLNNLLSNAVQFTDTPGTVTITLGATEEFAELRVADTGCGIEPEFLSHLFEPFRQAPQSLARPRGGLGLGLALVDQIVGQHGGRVHAQSPGTGRGATFTMVLPRAELHPHDPTVTPGPLSPLRILIVEDNEDTAMLFAHMLELVGHHVTIAHDAHEGLRAAAENELDVVLCDIGLPGDLDGFSFAEHMRERADPRAPALISLSGYGRREDEERALRSGFDRHLTKPVNLAALQRVIATVLEQHRAGR